MAQGQTAAQGSLDWASLAHERVTTVANGITLVRTVGGVALAVVALAQESLPILVLAYGVYWLGDILDGAAARHLDQETRIGAVFDIVSDRACTLLCAAAFIVVRPDVVVPVAIFLVQFAVIDTMLSLGFLYFPVKGPNDMHLVDRTLYRWNWSPPAKAANTTVVVLLSLAGLTWVAAAAALAVLALKLWSLRLLRALEQDRSAPALPTAPAGG